MTSDPGKQTADALKWLYEMEAVDSPVLRANLYENIFLADPGIVDCAAWITPTFTYQKGVLIWIKLGWKTRWFGKELALSRIEGVIKGLLPSYEIRIVEDRNILEMAQKKVEEVYGEQIYEEENSDTSDNLDTSDLDNDLKSPIEGDGLSETSDILPDSEKQAEDRQEIRTEAKQLDPQIDEKAQDIVDNLYSDPDARKPIPPKC